MLRNIEQYNVRRRFHTKIGGKMPKAVNVTEIQPGDIVRFRYCMCEVTETSEVVDRKGYDCIRVKGKNLNAEKNKKDKTGITKEEIFIDVRKSKTINKY